MLRCVVLPRAGVCLAEEFEQGGISIVSNQLSSLVFQMFLDDINGSNVKDSKRIAGSSPITFLMVYLLP